MPGDVHHDDRSDREADRSREYDKLVRDRIPEVIRENGETPVTRRADGAAYERRLREKLCEEAAEFRDEPSPEELGDVLDVIDAVVAAADFDRDAVERVRERKREERGGFEDGVVLERVDPE